MESNRFLHLYLRAAANRSRYLNSPVVTRTIVFAWLHAYTTFRPHVLVRTHRAVIRPIFLLQLGEKTSQDSGRIKQQQQYYPAHSDNKEA